jgi:hypothetical protein
MIKAMESVNVPLDTTVKLAKRKIAQMDVLDMVFVKQLNVLAPKVILVKTAVNAAAQLMI